MHAIARAGLVLAFSLLSSLPARAATLDVTPFTRDEAVSQLELSPDGTYYAATIPGEGRSMLAIVRRADNKATGMFSLGENTYVRHFAWVNPTRVVISMEERIGLLDLPRPTGNLYAMDADGGDPELLVGQDVNEMATGSRIRRKQTEHVAAFLLDDLRDDDRRVLVEVSGFGGDATRWVEKMDVYTGVRQREAGAPVINADFTTDHAGQVRFASGKTRANTQELYYRDGANSDWRLVNDSAKTGLGEYPIGFSADNKVAYLLAERADGPNAVVAFDPATGTRTEVFRDDDTDPAEIIRDGSDAPVGVRLHDGRTRSVFFDEAGAEARLVRSLEKAFADSVVRTASRTADGRWVVAEVASDRNAGDFYLYDTPDKHAAYMVSRRGWLDPADLAPMAPIALKARDGLDLHGYLTVPNGTDGKGLPMVVLPHGGPIGVADTWDYDGEVQLLAAAGYAVLQVNFRGSSNHGRKFKEAGARQWGRAMQDDITDATRWAIAQGIADPRRVCIYGGSYGAYAALMGAAREPDLYRCAVGYIGVYDLPLLHARGDTREVASGRAALQDWVGEPAELAAVSPVNLADRIEVPVFLAAGGKDERAPIEHSRRMQRALEKAGVPVETLYYDREGHGFHVPAHRKEYAERLLAFLGRHLSAGG